MIIPANFVVGALVGAVSTYVFKDEPAKEWLKDTRGKIKEGGSSFIASFKKKEDDSAAEIIEKGEVIEGVAEEIVEKKAEETTATDKDEKTTTKSTS